MFLANESVLNDNGSPFNGTWDTMDFTIPQEYQSEFARWAEVEFELQGSSVDLYYSTDRGKSWVSLAINQALSTDWATYKLYLDTVSKTIRIRLSNAYSNGTFSLRWLKVWFKPAGVR